MNKIAIISAVGAIVLLLAIAAATALNGSQMGNMEWDMMGSDLGMMGMHNQMMGNEGMMGMHNQMGNSSEMHKQCGKMMGIE